MHEQIVLIEYDDFGRMKYNAEYHFNQGAPWSVEDEEYLIQWLYKIGREEMSLALGRTESSISEKARLLRKQGKMKPDAKARNARLIKKEINKNKPRKKKSKKLNEANVQEIINLRNDKKTLSEIADIYHVSIYTIYTAIKEATKNPGQSVQSSMSKNTAPLYHRMEGIQVAN